MSRSHNLKCVTLNFLSLAAFALFRPIIAGCGCGVCSAGLGLQQPSSCRGFSCLGFLHQQSDFVPLYAEQCHCIQIQVSFTSAWHGVPVAECGPFLLIHKFYFQIKMWYFRNFTFIKIQHNEELWTERVLKEAFCVEKKKRMHATIYITIPGLALHGLINVFIRDIFAVYLLTSHTDDQMCQSLLKVMTSSKNPSLCISIYVNFQNRRWLQPRHCVWPVEIFSKLWAIDLSLSQTSWSRFPPKEKKSLFKVNQTILPLAIEK